MTRRYECTVVVVPGFMSQVWVDGSSWILCTRPCYAICLEANIVSYSKEEFVCLLELCNAWSCRLFDSSYKISVVIYFEENLNFDILIWWMCALPNFVE